MIAHRARPTPRLLQGLALVFGALLGAVALAPTLAVAAVLIVAMGAASVGFIATANATLQLSSEPSDARSGDGPLRDGIPRHHADRGAPGRVHRRTDRSEGRPPGRIPGNAGGRPACSGGVTRSGFGRRTKRATAIGPRRLRSRPGRSSREWPDRALRDGHRRPSRRGQAGAAGLGSLGRPSTRSPTMFRWISAVPPQMVSEREKKKDAWRSLTG